MVWKASVLTSQPEMFPGPLAFSVTGRGLEQGLWSLETVDYRSFAEDKHQRIDDTPYGGGAGMVLKPDILYKAYEKVADGRKAYVLSPRGRPIVQSDFVSISQTDGVILACGRYEGIDQRAIDHLELEEVSIGDYVLSGGELAACVMVDACVRLLPDVLGNPESLASESFDQHLLEHPHYTKPAQWQGLDVPQVLLSGHHGEIDAWRLEKAEKLTQERRPDLWQKYLSTSQKKHDKG